MANIKVSARPPVKKKKEDLDELKLAFVQSGDIHSTEKKDWEKARPDVCKTFNLRLSEEYYIKLDYASSKIRKSKHSICIDAVQKAIDHLLDLIDSDDHKVL